MLKKIHYDTNGHEINEDGTLVWDKECEVCRKERPQKEDSHKQEFIKSL